VHDPVGTLLAHEWAKHGACMAPRRRATSAPRGLLWSGLRWPDFDRWRGAAISPRAQVREAFAQANRLWEPEDVGLVLNERGWLQELRLCYDRRFRPAACDARRFGPPIRRR
jgi:ribonuclease T2